jgi:hypothetical protein
LQLPPSSLTARVSSRLHRRSLTARVTSSPPSLPPPPELPAPSLPRRLSHHLHRRPFTATVLPPPSPPELLPHLPISTIPIASSLPHFTSRLHRRYCTSPRVSIVAICCLHFLYVLPPPSPHHVSTLRLTSTICVATARTATRSRHPPSINDQRTQSTINALNQRYPSPLHR